jgi:hypothetical protein
MVMNGMRSQVVFELDTGAHTAMEIGHFLLQICDNSLCPVEVSFSQQSTQIGDPCFTGVVLRAMTGKLWPLT